MIVAQKHVRYSERLVTLRLPVPSQTEQINKITTKNSK